MRVRLARKPLVRGLWICLTAVMAVAWLGVVVLRATGGDPRNTGMAAPQALVAAYDRFVALATPANTVVLSLSNLRGVSSDAVNAGGRVTVDLSAGTVTSSVQLLPSEGTFDLWLIDNRPANGATTLADEGDTLINVGAYEATASGHTLASSLGAAAFAGFFPDRAFVVRSGDSPVDRFVLTGPATLFDRLRHRQLRYVDDPSARLGFDPGAAGTRLAGFERVIADGRRLFLNETFQGNGRTCGTCHVETNNFTVDPDFIASLPANDPLFVAEHNPALATLENSDLLRRFGLILVNADGFDPARGFVLRSTQNVQALANSMKPQDDQTGVDFSTFGPNPNPPERLGWGNDGPPLRDFAIVAIVQHGPKTLGRSAGVDFRLPTDEELDALAAYQLAIGRQEDFTLTTLELRSALASNGKTLFLDTGNIEEPGHKNCNACHFNGGGTTGMSFNPAHPGFPRLDGTPQGFNIAAATSTSDMPEALALGLPRDGGFGQVPTVFGSFGNVVDFPPELGGFHLELEEFNSPPVVESADTGPFFHHHAAPDLESAVAFYGSDAFKGSFFAGGTPVDLEDDPADPEVLAIAAFLRVLNALENIRSSIDVAERGRTMTRVADLRDLARLSLAEVADALEVLSQGAFAGSGEPAIRSARLRLAAAKVAMQVAQHLQSAWAIDELLGVATRQLRAARSALADPATLPPSFRN
jgi:mono/diheme cytochrome c family protein